MQTNKTFKIYMNDMFQQFYKVCEMLHVLALFFSVCNIATDNNPEEEIRIITFIQHEMCLKISCNLHFCHMCKPKKKQQQMCSWWYF